MYTARTRTWMRAFMHKFTHANALASIHSYLRLLGSALFSERPPVLGLWRRFPVHPVLK
jgi:hypothetical protein